MADRAKYLFKNYNKDSPQKAEEFEITLITTPGL